jgi:hypothetical protein
MGFLRTEMETRGLTVGDLKSGQFEIQVNEIDEIERIVKGLENKLRVLLWRHLAHDHTEDRMEFVNSMAAWLWETTQVGEDSNDKKWKFFVSQAVADVDEVATNVLGPANPESLHCGVGAQYCLDTIRCTRQALAATAGDSDSDMDEEDELGLDCTSASSNASLLRQIVEEIERRVKADPNFGRMLGLLLEDGEVVFEYNHRQVNCVDGEQFCCEAGYRPMLKTFSSRRTKNPIGYNKYTHPSLGHERRPVSSDDLVQARERHQVFLAQRRGAEPGVKAHVIGPLPHPVFRLPTEDASDAFDSGDEDLEEERKKRSTANPGDRNDKRKKRRVAL